MDQSPHLRKLLVLSVLGFLASGLGVGIALAAAPNHPSAGPSVPSASASNTPPPSSSAVLAIPPPTTTGVPIILSGDGMGAAVFGQPATVVMNELESVLGAPSSLNGVPGDCAVDAVATWSTIDAFFSQGTFVGYDGGALLNATTDNGLRVGDTLAQAEQLVPGGIDISSAQGGSWSIATPAGQLTGLLVGSGVTVTPTSQIADISAGTVGCPAVSR